MLAVKLDYSRQISETLLIKNSTQSRVYHVPLSLGSSSRALNALWCRTEQDSAVNTNTLIHLFFSMSHLSKMYIVKEVGLLKV